jgi:type IV secretory pathway TrbD component
MKENVGGADRTLRLISGPALVVLGFTVLNGRRGRLKGLATMIAGVLTLESGITKVCPLNRMVGRDTA